MEEIGDENYGFFVYGLGHYSFFGEHRPGKSDIWNDYKTSPKDAARPEFTADTVSERPRRFAKAFANSRKPGSTRWSPCGKLAAFR